MGGLTNGTPYTFTVGGQQRQQPGLASNASNSASPFAYVRASSPTSPPPAADPWIGGQYIDLTNVSGNVARLGGYGLWDAQSSRYVNGRSVENRAAFLFDPATTLDPGATMRVYFPGASHRPRAARSRSTSLPATDLAPSSDTDFVELANLNGAQIACRGKSGTSCARAQTTSVPSSPVGITARSTASDVTVAWGAPISRGGLAISSYAATAYDAPVGGNAIASCSAGGGDRSCVFPASMGRTYYVEVVATNAARHLWPVLESQSCAEDRAQRPGQRVGRLRDTRVGST